MKEMLITIAKDIADFFYDYAGTGAKVAAVAVIVYWCPLFLWRGCLKKKQPAGRQSVVKS